MCGRFIAKTDANWERFFSLKKPPPEFVSYNIAPSQRVPVVRFAAAGRQCDLLRWGLVPFFAHGVAPRYHTINARSETVASSPAYRTAWRRGQRCIVPANGFYEWQLRPDGRKQPYFIRLADRELFGFAGLWDASVSEAGETIESFALLTVPASPLMASIHNSRQREPVILEIAEHERWLAGDAEAARRLLVTGPDERLLAWPVGTRVNSPRNDDEQLLQPLDQVKE